MTEFAKSAQRKWNYCLGKSASRLSEVMKADSCN
jgi:hypothetical protein